jgi:hypothetical protein
MFLLLPVLLPLTVFRPPARPAARAASCPRIVGTAQGVVLTYDNLSRRLQPGYNYVGQTNARRPYSLVPWVGCVITSPSADCCVGPGRRAPNPPTLIPAVGCRSRILKHWSRKWARRKKPTAIKSSKNNFFIYTVIIIVYCVFI